LPALQGRLGEQKAGRVEARPCGVRPGYASLRVCRRRERRIDRNQTPPKSPRSHRVSIVIARIRPRARCGSPMGLPPAPARWKRCVSRDFLKEFMNQSCKATTEGTSNYKNRFTGVFAEGHFRQSQGLWMSSIGLGSYLGGADEQTDEAYRIA